MLLTRTAAFGQLPDEISACGGHLVQHTAIFRRSVWNRLQCKRRLGHRLVAHAVFKTQIIKLLLGVVMLVAYCFLTPHLMLADATGDVASVACRFAGSGDSEAGRTPCCVVNAHSYPWATA